jgi:hypothetical protein
MQIFTLHYGSYVSCVSCPSHTTTSSTPQGYTSAPIYSKFDLFSFHTMQGLSDYSTPAVPGAMRLVGQLIAVTGNIFTKYIHACMYLGRLQQLDP